MKKKFGLIISGALFISGCCPVGQKYESPEDTTPCEWQSNFSAGMNSDLPECFVWWESLNDPVLNSLIERAASQNLDMHIAATRVLEVRREQKGVEASVYPHIDGSANYGNVDYNQKVVNQLLGQRKHKSNQHNVNFFEIGFDAEWEIDLFGKNAYKQDAAKARLESTEEEMHAIWITLSAEIGKNYVDLRGLQNQLLGVEKTLQVRNDTYQLNQDLSNNGFVNSIDQLQTQEQMNVLTAQKIDIQVAITRTIYRISVLLGQTPGALFAELIEPSQLPHLPIQQSIGIPSELLRRRPDIKKAERDLAQANANLNIAMAAFFPSFSLRGFVGDIATLCTGGFSSYVGPQLLFPIFNSKLIESDIDINKLKKQEAFYLYQKKVLEVLEEAENAIASFAADADKQEFFSKSQKINQETYELTQDLYNRGMKNSLELIAVESALLNSDEKLLQSQIDALIHYISLYKALGGGWEIQVCEN